MYKYQISFAFKYDGIRQARIVVLLFPNRLKAKKFARDKVLHFIGCCEDATTTCRVNVREV